ncbi:MAG: ATP-dependent DNA helicase RecG [bacterium]|nr:ATP-dependent DNA helicase RecG [bacterium]
MDKGLNTSLQNRLIAVKRPLQYTAKNSFSNLSKVKNLHSLIPSLLEEIPLNGIELYRKRLATLTADFKEFEALSTANKKLLIKEALTVIDGIVLPASKKSETAPFMPEDASSRESLADKDLKSPVLSIKGVGPKIVSLLAKMGMNTVEDLLYHFPQRYDDRRNIRKIATLKKGEVQQVIGEVLAAGESSLSARRRIYEVVIGDGTGTLTLKWFHYNKRYMKSLYPEGKRFLASGEVKLFGGSREIIHPDMEGLEEGEEVKDDFLKILPVYPLTEGLGQRALRKIIANAVVRFSEKITDAIPCDIKDKRALINEGEAIYAVHLPHKNADIKALNDKMSLAHRSLVYDEFFFIELGMAIRSRGIELESGVEIDLKYCLKERLIEKLPFELTGAQKRVLREVEKDLAAKFPMHRLLQGDVGCGKTMVALISALHAVEAGYQSAIMAPTEILAEQHFINIRSLAESLGLKTALIKGSMKAKEKSEVVGAIASGGVHIVIGTHAMIQEGVVFKRLGLGIIDEQHRFGVVQRGVLRNMGDGGMVPNILVMTATPIPRSLAMTVYGDLELSVIDELPPGRQEIETKVYHERERDSVYSLILGELEKGRQAYIVYPLVEESEKMDLLDATGMASELSAVFSDFKVGLIHGRMKVDEKEGVMADFKSGRLNILVSTTVIEVGIDIPNASVMVVEHAERFGLSQLHQLRGRVGRGSDKSICVLLAQYQKSDEARERLRVMEKYSSGFDISEADLRLRGPGDFLGTRQSGLPDFRIGNILKDERILKIAREDAFEIIEKDPRLETPDHAMLKNVLVERWKGRLQLAGAG